MKVCEVPACPAFAYPGLLTCRAHKDARTAKALRVSADEDGRNGKRCLSCKRVFKPDDYVSRTMRKKATRGRPGEPYGWAHVACEPPSVRPSRKLIRDAPKPLLEAVDDIERDRGAA